MKIIMNAYNHPLKRNEFNRIVNDKKRWIEWNFDDVICIKDQLKFYETLDGRYTNKYSKVAIVTDVLYPPHENFMSNFPIVRFLFTNEL